MISKESKVNVSCPLCGREDDEELWEKDGFRVARCRACSLVYVNPRLTMETLSELYNDQIISYTSYYVRWAPVDRRTFAQRLDLIERMVKPGSMLELGCGPGTLMQVARERGWKTRGIDVNAESVQLCHEAGLDVVCGTFPHESFAGQTFDVAVMNDFIEHVPDPGAVLGGLRELLEPGGLIFLTTPDVGSPIARLTGRRWSHLKPNEHLLYFDRNTIREMMRRAGFEVVKIRAMGRVRNLGLALERLGEYSPGLGKLTRAVIPDKLAEAVNVPINPGDEMAVVARRV